MWLALLAGCAACAPSGGHGEDARRPSGTSRPPRVDRSPVPHERWSPPPPDREVRLLDRAMRTAGDEPDADPSLITFDATKIAGWRRSRVGDAVRFTTPRLPPGLGGARALRLRARPGGASGELTLTFWISAEFGQEKAYRYTPMDAE